MHWWLSTFRLFAATGLLAFAADSPPIPDTPKKPVVDEYHGVKVTDDYRWLENLNDPAIRKWSDAENAHARAILDGISSRPQIRQRLLDLYKSGSSTYSALNHRGGLMFALKREPLKEQPMLVTLASADEISSEHVVVDPNALDAAGGTTIDFYVPSLDGKLAAVSLSRGGSEEGSLHIFDVASGKRLDEVIPRVNGATAGGSVAWNGAGTGFYYTRYPRKGERPDADIDFYQQVYFHRIGSPVGRDAYSIGKEFPRIAEVALTSSDDGKNLVATVANGDGGDFLHYLQGASGQWRQITRLLDQTSQARFGGDGTLYLVTKKSAPQGRILRLAAPDYDVSKSTVLVPAGRFAIDDFVVSGSRMYVAYVAGGPMQLHTFDLEGHEQPQIPVRPVSSVQDLVRLPGDQLLFENVSYLEPAAYYRYDPKSGEVLPTALVRKSPADFSDAEVVRRMVTSKDGTKVPLNILMRKGTKLTGSNPVLLTGYGGYNVSVSPAFALRLRLWLDRGGIFAEANLRGGAEFGETWHQQGMLKKKQNVFDDFLACAEFLIREKYTNAQKLAIEGGSNGGLLMGAALTQRPDLFRAVVAHVGIYDMLRVELSPNGSFNVTEYGTVKEMDQFQALYAYSPYHRVKDGTDYPAVLFLTGDNDGRVDPANSRKMTARLQAASHSGRPVLLRTSSGSGHGFGTALTERVDQEADVFTFLFDQLGM